MQIKLLDCTLRDGAYIVDGNFSTITMKGILAKLTAAGVDIIECGWLKNSPHKDGVSYFQHVEDIVQYLPAQRNYKVSYVVMMGYGMYDLDNLPDYDGTSINSIRVVFPIEKFEEAIPFCQKIKDKGYKVCLQAANTLSYSDAQLLELVKETNELNPYSLSIVDTFGQMYSEDLMRIFTILDNNLKRDIKLGFHSHNNLQLSFALTIEFIKFAQIVQGRDIIIDSSLCGMGRGAGNATTELVVNYLNAHHRTNYDLNIIMDMIDIYMNRFIVDYHWGYSVPYFIAGMYGSHVNNIQYLQENHKTKSKDMKLIIEAIPKLERKKYNHDLLEQIYLKHCSCEVDDFSAAST